MSILNNEVKRHITEQYLMDTFGVELESLVVSQPNIDSGDEFIPFSRGEHKLKAENDHDLMSMTTELSLLSNVRFDEALHTVVEDKCKLYIGDEQIKIKLNNGKVSFTLGDAMISGIKRLIVLKEVWRHSDIYDITSDGEWTTYIFKFNGKVFRGGYLNGNQNASYMVLFYAKQWEPTVDEYYKQWVANNNKNHSLSETGNIELHSEAFGDAETGLGSIVTDQVEDELLEAYKTMAKYADTAVFKQLFPDFDTTQL